MKAFGEPKASEATIHERIAQAAADYSQYPYSLRFRALRLK